MKVKQICYSIRLERKNFMKKKLKRVFALVCAFTLVATSFSFAAEEQSAEDMVQAGVPQVTSKTVTDDHGNKYKVTGMSSIVGKKGETYTEFKTTLYKDGKKAPVDAYTKKLTALGRVWFSGAASDNQYGDSPKNMTGATGTLKRYDSYDFYIKTLHSTHKFSCEGGSTSFYTQM